jgi:SulP family sulfate permease
MVDNTMSGDTGGAKTFAEKLREEFEPSRLIPSVTAGLIVSIIVVIVSVSLATLIFSGDMEQYLPQGIGLMLFSGVLITAIIAIWSSYPGMVAYPQERVAPILAVVAAVVSRNMADTASTEEIFFTVVAAVTLASLASGVFLFALGTFKLGALIRFIPYPVIGGFLAGTGWLLVRGSLGVMMGKHLHMSDIPEFF